MHELPLRELAQSPPGYGPPPGYGYGPPGAPPGGSHGSAFGGAPPAPPRPPRTDQLAIAGLISSIVGLVGAIINGISGLFGACCVICTVGATVLGVLVLIPSVAGVIMGGLSISRINARPEELTGKGLAVAALVVGLLATFAALAEIVLPWLGIACFAAAGSAGGP